MTRISIIQRRPIVALMGAAAQPEFADAVALLDATADVVRRPGVAEADLVVLAQSRPETISSRELAHWRSTAPLAGVVSLLGTWCEGEARTGRPPVGVRRLYWYDFPSWWRRQLALWSVGRCPDWARTDDAASIDRIERGSAMIAVDTTCWETASVLGDALRAVGYATVDSRDESWQRGPVIAGVWEGCQLNAQECARLERFCRDLAARNAPVIALLDFPRRDRCAVAYELGAATVLGKPWENAALIGALATAIGRRRTVDAPSRAA